MSTADYWRSKRIYNYTAKNCVSIASRQSFFVFVFSESRQLQCKNTVKYLFLKNRWLLTMRTPVSYSRQLASWLPIDDCFLKTFLTVWVQTLTLNISALKTIPILNKTNNLKPSFNNYFNLLDLIIVVNLTFELIPQDW